MLTNNTKMSKKGISDFYWTIAFVVIIVILGGGWLAFVVRSGSGAEIAQDYMVRNLAYLSTTMIISPSLASYCFSAKSDIDFQIEYNPKTLDVASRVSKGNITGFPSPSKYLRPFPTNYEIKSSKFVNDFCMINLNNLFVLNNDLSGYGSDECKYYSQFDFDKTKSNTNLLFLSSSNETLTKLNIITPSLGIASQTELLDTFYTNGTNDEYDIIIIVEENEINNPKILIGTPLILSKKLGCSFQNEFSYNIEQTSLDIDNSKIVLLLLTDGLDNQKLISAITGFLG